MFFSIITNKLQIIGRKLLRKFENDGDYFKNEIWMPLTKHNSDKM